MGEEDQRTTTALVMLLRDKHPEWGVGSGVGFTYNGKSIVYTSRPLPLPATDRFASLASLKPCFP
jgi:hypothetical protein